MLDLELVCRASLALRGLLHRTPLVQSATLSEQLGADVYVKLENLQKTGSFKPRGAFFKMLSLDERQRAAGVVAVSGGNHAQGVAYAARHLGIQSTICMPRSTPQNYLDATREYGAEIVLCENIATAFAETARRERSGATLVHPFDDPLIAAGQGTIGLEILDDLPGVSRVYLSIGGGGLITGVATAIKTIAPQVRVFGVQTRGADAMAQSLAAGRLIELPQITSIARTLGAPKVSEFTLSAVQRLVEEVLVVDDAEAFAALKRILERTKQLVEPAAACCLAAAERHRDTWRPDEKIVLLMCGGNVSVADLARFEGQFAIAPPPAEREA